MKWKKLDKFIGKKVELRFSRCWFNEASGMWVEFDEPYIGVLIKRGLSYMFEENQGSKLMATSDAQWTASMVEKVVEKKEERK